MVDSIDQNVGRLLDALDELGELDNTIFLFTSDNGASREGEQSGTTAYFRDRGSRTQDATEASGRRPATASTYIGGPTTWPHYPRGWAMASNTPFRLYKINTYARRPPGAVHRLLAAAASTAPGRRSGGSTRTSPTCCPTLVDLIGLDAARPSATGSRPARPPAPAFGPARATRRGPSRTPSSTTSASATAATTATAGRSSPSTEPLTPFAEDHWQLYDLAERPDAARRPRRRAPGAVAELAAAWEDAAWANQVFPLDEGTGSSTSSAAGPSERRSSRPVRLMPGTPTLERWRSSQPDRRPLVPDRRRLGLPRGRRGRPRRARRPGGRATSSTSRTAPCTSLQNAARQIRTCCRRAARRGRAARSSSTSAAPGGGDWEVELIVDGDEPGRAATASPAVAASCRSRASTSASTAARPSRGSSTSGTALPVHRRLTAVTYEPGELSPDAGQRLIDEADRVGIGLE